MTRIAFYAPMKAPTHANPSGDREIARNLLAALKIAEFQPQLASTLRCLDMRGDAAVQNDLIAQSDSLIPQLIAQGKAEGWRLWLTYHNYYKAPDLLGPHVSQALKIPYVQIESTRARKRLTGPWALFAEAAENAAHTADLIFFFTQRDAVALRDYGPQDQRLVHLPPFVPWETLPQASSRSGSILTPAMMRPGDKLESYKLIARSLALATSDWRLAIAGDGKARDTVEHLMAPFGDRVTFVGQQNADGMGSLYSTARLMFWPGVNEAIGMTYLEAQAYGIPILAQNRPGLIDGLSPALSYPYPEDGPEALARQLNVLLRTPPAAETIQAHIKSRHLLPAAAATLGSELKSLLRGSS